MTNVLTDAEIRAIQARHPTENDPMDFAHAIIAAALNKLSAGVSVEPHEYVWEPDGTFNIEQKRCLSPNTGPCSGWNVYPVYTADAIAAARVAALEEAAACAFDEVQYMMDFDKADIVSAQIRALIGKEST